MHAWRAALLVSLLACGPGCQTNNTILLLERELRLKDSQIYELEQALEEYDERLASCQRENATLRRRGEGEPQASDEPAPRRLLPPRSEEPLPTPDDAVPPKIDLGEETTPEVPPSKKNAPEAKGASHHAPLASRRSPLAAQHAPLAPRSTSLEFPPATLQFHPRLTGGNNTDGRPGDDGILAVLQVRDAQGRLLDAPGDVLLEVIDPAETGTERMVAQWDFRVAETARRFRRAPLATGFYFDMPWPGKPPRNARLRLRAEYRTADGRVLTAEQRFDAELLPLAHPTAPQPRALPAAQVRSHATTADRPTWRPVR